MGTMMDRGDLMLVDDGELVIDVKLLIWLTIGKFIGKFIGELVVYLMVN